VTPLVWERPRKLTYGNMVSPLLAAPAHSPRPKPRRWSVSRLTVALLAGWVAADLGLRLLPPEWFDIIDAEIARQWHPIDAPFTANRRFYSNTYRGDETIVGNLKPTETASLRTFRTDELGFRYTPAVRPGEPPEVIALRGFSYTWGALLDDQETFTAGLARGLGVNVYNGAWFHEDPERPADVRRLLRKLGAQPSVAVYVHLEPNGHERSWHAPSRVDRMGEAVLGSRYADVASRADWLRRTLRAWLEMSPLTAMAKRASRAVHDGRILTNPRANAVVSFPLPNGTRLLNRAGDFRRVMNPPDNRTVAARAEYIEDWSKALAQDGMATIVVLVPEKMSVYGPALGLRLAEDPYLNRLERELRRRGLRTVNMLPLLRASAPHDLATGKLAYFREDQHWNAEGVSRIAAEAAQAIRRAGLLRTGLNEQAQNRL
jgi:hypothetical protein